MTEPIPAMKVTMEWDHALEFTGFAGRHEVGIDGAQASAPSPMQYMALAISGCMGIDIVHILTRGRHQLKGLQSSFSGERSPIEPKRFTHITLHYTVRTDAPPEAVERAIQLSRDKYCSAMTSLRQDIGVDVGFTVEPL